MDTSYSGSFYDDEPVVEDDNNNNDQQDDDDDENDTLDLEAEVDSTATPSSPTAAALLKSKKQSSGNNNNGKKPQDTVYCFASDESESAFPRSRTLEMKRRENDWFLVVYRDMKALVDRFKIADNKSTNGNFSVINGREFADSDALQIRLKRNCSVLTSALSSQDGDQYFTPKAIELMFPVFMPFVLSEELMFGCRSTWNTIVQCIRNIIRRMKAPPRHYNLNALYDEKLAITGGYDVTTSVNNKTNDDDDTDDQTEDSATESSAVSTPVQQPITSTPSPSNNNLAHETSLNLEWRPLFAFCQKIVGASVIGGQGQAYDLVGGLLLSMMKCVPSKTLTEIWTFTRRHFVGYLTSAFAGKLLPVKILGRQHGAVDTDSIKQQCETLSEMLEWIAATWKVPHTIGNTEETFCCLAHNILAPVGLRLFEKNRQAFDDFVVPLRKRVLELLQPHFRISFGASKSSRGKVNLSSDWSVRLLALLIVRDEEIGWSELIRWRRVLEPACSPKATNSVPIRYLSNVIHHVQKETQKRLNLLRSNAKPTPARDVLNEVNPALEGEKLQKFLSLTVPLVSNMSFNARLFTNYSYANWMLNFMDPTPSTAARTLASVQVGMSEAGKETKQITQALKILSDQLCAISAQTLHQISTDSSEKNSIHGKMWRELLPTTSSTSSSSSPPPLVTHTNPGGALKEAAVEILKDANSPVDCAKKTVSTFFYQALENMESTVQDRVNDALRCIYSLVIFGQCDHLPLDDRRGFIRAFMDKIQEKYFPVEAQLSATTAGILHYAFAGCLRLVSDDLTETRRIIDLICDMLSKPSIHETLSTCLRTMVAAILEQGATRLFARTVVAENKNNIDNDTSNDDDSSNSNRKSLNNIKQDHADLLHWFCPIIEQTFNAAQVELANDLTTTSRFVGNVYVVCTVLEHLPAPVLRQLCLDRLKSFVEYLIDWCRKRAANPDITEKEEADLRCATSSIQSILDCGIRSLLTPMPYDTNYITLGEDAEIWQSSKSTTLYIEPGVEDQQAARDTIIGFMNVARDHLLDIPKNAEHLGRALRCNIVGRIIGGTRNGTWALNRMSEVTMKALDDEIGKNFITTTSTSSSEDSSSSTTATTTTTINHSEEPSQDSAWWTARVYELEKPIDRSLTDPVEGCTPEKKMRDLTDYDTELYMWLLQEMLSGFCNNQKQQKNDDDDKTNNTNDDASSTTTTTINTLSRFPLGQYHDQHPLNTIDSFIEIDDIPLSIYKTVLSMLDSNYTFDYTGLLNEIEAPGDDAGRILFHYKMTFSRSMIRSRDKSGAFGRASSDWSCRKEAATMLNLSFSKSVIMRQQAQNILSSFISSWVVAGIQQDLVEEIIQSLKTRFDMANPGWLARLSDVNCKCALYMITKLCGVLGREHTYQLAEPLLAELCLGGELRRPSNERRKEGTISILISKLQSSSYGPAAAVCDRQLARWLDLAMEPGRAPISITRCLKVSLGYFRHTLKLSDRCCTNAEMRWESLSHVTEEHLQFLMSLATQLHRATEYAWKVLHNVGLIVARELHFTHTHLPVNKVTNASNSCKDEEISPHVKFYGEYSEKTHDDNDPWIPLEGPRVALTYCCPFTSNNLTPSASCSVLHRKHHTWGKISGHLSDLAKCLGQSFLNKDFIRQCLDVHVSLLRSEAIAGERSGRKTAAQRVQSSPLANAIEWSRFGRCALWYQLADAYENHDAKGMVKQKDSAEEGDKMVSLCELEMKSLHRVTSLWMDVIQDLLPQFDASGLATVSPSTRSPALSAASPKSTGAEQLPPLDDSKNQQQQQERHVDAAAASATAASSPIDANPVKKQQQQEQQKTSVICEFLAGNALCRGLFGALQHLGFPVDKTNPTVINTRKDIIRMIKGLFTDKMLQPNIPHEAAALFLGSWSGFAGAVNLEEKEDVHRWLIGIVCQSQESLPQSGNELVRRRAWQALRRSHGSPARSMWHEAILLEDAFMVGKLLNEENMNTAINDPSRSVRAEANLTFRNILESSVVARIESFYDYKSVKTGFPVDEELLRSDEIARGVEDKLLALRLAALREGVSTSSSSSPATTSDTSSSSSNSKAVRAALSLISLVTAGVALEKVIPEIPNIATTLISVPSEAASANALTDLRRAPSDFDSLRRILSVLVKSLKNEIARAKNGSSSQSPSSPDAAAVATTGNEEEKDESSPTSSVSQIMARVAPLIIYIRYLANSRYAHDLMTTSEVLASLSSSSSLSTTHILDVIATAFVLPGRQLLSQVSLTLSTWTQILPREDVRQFVIRSIKSLDAAAVKKDSVMMKLTIASLGAVVNAFSHSVPSFVPASLMRLVKYKNMITLSRDEREELERQKEKEKEKASENENGSSSASASATPDRAPSSSSSSSSPDQQIKKTEDYKSLATEGLQHWWAVHLQAWEQEHKSSFTEAQAQAISDACKARSYFV